MSCPHNLFDVCCNDEDNCTLGRPEHVHANDMFEERVHKTEKNKHEPEQTRSQKLRDAGITRRQKGWGKDGDESDEDYEALANKQLASLKEAGKKTFEDAAVRALNKLYNTEPVAWMEFERFMDEDGLMSERKVLYTWDPCRGVPLYTAPPQREWVGLTDEEIREFELWLDDEEEKHGWNPPADIVKYLEAKLKEKNETNK